MKDEGVENTKNVGNPHRLIGNPSYLIYSERIAIVSGQLYVPGRASLVSKKW
jgi:hypothetical protein